MSESQFGLTREDILNGIEKRCRQAIKALRIQANVSREESARKTMVAGGYIEKPCTESIVITLHNEAYRGIISITDLEQDMALPLGIEPCAGVPPFVQGEVWVDRYANVERWGFRASSMKDIDQLIPNLFSSLVYWLLMGEEHSKVEG